MNRKYKNMLAFRVIFNNNKKIFINKNLKKKKIIMKKKIYKYCYKKQ